MYVDLHVGCQQLLHNLIQTRKTSTNAEETPEISNIIKIRTAIPLGRTSVRTDR